MKLILCIAFLLVTEPFFAQSFPEKKIAVQAIGINQGLSQGMINCIWQDHYGFMWFGTMDGLNRYDGYKFQVFRNTASDSNSISGNFITSIFEDSKGRLWVGTALNGLNLFIPETEQFVRFTTTTQPAVSNNTILSIQEDMFGYIWIATQRGLNKLTVTNNFNKYNLIHGSATQLNKQVSFIHIKPVVIKNAIGKEMLTANSDEPVFLITKNGMIWVSASHSVFKIMPLETGEEKLVQEGIPLLYSKFDKDNSHIYKIAEDTTNNMICFKGNDFFITLNERNSKTSLWNCAPLDLSMTRNQIVFNDGILWERTPDGLFCFDVLQKKVYRIRSYNAEHEEMLKAPFSIFRDRSGIIWIGTGGYGLLKYIPRTEYFHTVITKSITWMSATPSGDVLLMTPEIKYFVNDTSGRQPQYRNNETFAKKLETLAKKLPDIGLQDKKGNYWLNASYGITQVNMATKTIRNVKESSEPIFPYFLDNKDRFWYATQQHFCLLDSMAKSVASYPFPIAPVVISPYKFCQVIFQDAKGIFWLGTTEGLFGFNEATRQWRHYQNKPGDPASLSNNIIFSICDDPQGPGDYLWVGTNGGGLNRFCVSTGRFEHIGMEDGLPNMVIYGILVDDEKQLWMSTNKGITCLKPQYSNNQSMNPGKITGNKFRCYYEENGLQSNEFNRNAYCKTKDGILFFGGVNGFNYFNPKQVTGNIAIPNVVITEFKINNKPVSFKVQNIDDTKAVLSKPAFLTDTIELAYKDNMVTFEFASLDFTASEKNSYQYKMENFDEEWIQSGNNHAATYTNLDPGTYTFMVRGSNSDGIWNEKGTSVQLIIMPPWYMTWWFRTIALATIATLLYLTFRYLLKQKLKLLDVRNHIATDLHDEIGSTLSSVYIYSEVAQRTSDTPNLQTNNYLKLISTDTGKMIDALSDIVWTVNGKNDRFENIINRMRATAIELFEAKGFHMHLNFTDALHTSKLGMTHRKNFYLFYKEAINNAAKYACCENVWITLTYKKPNILLSVKDDGQGFVFDNKHSGNGLNNMQRRATELKGIFKIITSPGMGTEVQLRFSA